MENNPLQLRDLLEPVIEKMGFLLAGIELSRPHFGRGTLRLYIETLARQVTLDDCVLVSEQVSTLLDVHDPIKDRYLLEVSSPGIERTIFLGRDFPRFLGETLRLRLRYGVAGRRKWRGILQAADAETLLLAAEEASEVLKIPLSAIEKAQLVYLPFAQSQVPAAKKTGKAHE
jgi:ribosome maturation factor RimP